MLLILPFVIIVCVIFTIDMYYYDTLENMHDVNQKNISQDINKTNSRQIYIDKYLK